MTSSPASSNLPAADDTTTSTTPSSPQKQNPLMIQEEDALSLSAEEPFRKNSSAQSQSEASEHDASPSSSTLNDVAPKTDSHHQPHTILDDKPNYGSDASQTPNAATSSSVPQQENWRVPIHNFIKTNPKYTKKRKVKRFYKEQNEFVDELYQLHEDMDPPTPSSSAGVPLIPPRSSVDSTVGRESLDAADSKLTDVQLSMGGSGAALGTSNEDAASCTAEDPIESPHSSGKQPDGISGHIKQFISKTIGIEQFCLALSFFSNLMIFVVKLTASIASGSLALIASTIDSSLDLATGLILFVANRLRYRKTSLDYLHYPLGKSRLEPVAYIIFACIVCTATMQMIITSFQTVLLGVINQIEGNLKEVPFVDNSQWVFWFSLATFGFVVVWKTLLFLVCRPVKSSPAVQAYAQDHRNDVIFNTCLAVAVGCGSLSDYLWWLDPFFAFLVSVFILQGWMRNIVEYVRKLVGHSADAKTLSKLTHLAFSHDPRILFIDTVRGMYVGLGMLVEVDIVLPEDMPLKEAHDIGESLQVKIEELEDVERCWVHLDFEFHHSPYTEHKRPK